MLFSTRNRPRLHGFKSRCGPLCGRTPTAEPSRRVSSSCAPSPETLISATAGHAPAFQERHEQDARRREVEDVLRAAVGGPAHLHDLEGPKEVAAALQVAGHDHPVRQGFLDAPMGIPFFRGPDFRDEEGGAAFRAQDRPEAEEEVSDPFLVFDSIADGRHGIQDESADFLILDHPRDRVREEPCLLEVDLLLVDAELLVDLREVDELELPLLRQLVVEELERDHVHKELVRRLRDAEIEAVLALQRPADQELDAHRGLARADGSGDEDRVAAGDSAVQDVIDRVDAGDASLPLTGVALLRGHRLMQPTRGALFEMNALSIRPEITAGPAGSGAARSQPCLRLTLTRGRP